MERRWFGEEMINRITLLLFIGLALWSCEDNDKCIDESKISDDYNCDDIYDPVCGCDEVTYSNACEAENSGVTEWTEGECN